MRRANCTAAAAPSPCRGMSRASQVRLPGSVRPAKARIAHVKASDVRSRRNRRPTRASCLCGAVSSPSCNDHASPKCDRGQVPVTFLSRSARTPKLHRNHPEYIQVVGVFRPDAPVLRFPRSAAQTRVRCDRGQAPVTYVQEGGPCPVSCDLNAQAASIMCSTAVWDASLSSKTTTTASSS